MFYKMLALAFLVATAFWGVLWAFAVYRGNVDHLALAAMFLANVALFEIYKEKGNG